MEAVRLTLGLGTKAASFATKSSGSKLKSGKIPTPCLPSSCPRWPRQKVTSVTLNYVFGYQWTPLHSARWQRLSQRDMEAYFGTSGRVSEVLNGRRQGAMKAGPDPGAATP